METCGSSVKNWPCRMWRSTKRHPMLWKCCTCWTRQICRRSKTRKAYQGVKMHRPAERKASRSEGAEFEVRQIWTIISVKEKLAENSYIRCRAGEFLPHHLRSERNLSRSSESPIRTCWPSHGKRRVVSRRLSDTLRRE